MSLKSHSRPNLCQVTRVSWWQGVAVRSERLWVTRSPGGPMGQCGGPGRLAAAFPASSPTPAPVMFEAGEAARCPERPVVTAKDSAMRCPEHARDLASSLAGTARREPADGAVQPRTLRARSPGVGGSALGACPEDGTRTRATAVARPWPHPNDRPRLPPPPRPPLAPPCPRHHHGQAVWLCRLCSRSLPSPGPSAGGSSSQGHRLPGEPAATLRPSAPAPPPGPPATSCLFARAACTAWPGPDPGPCLSAGTFLQ